MSVNVTSAPQESSQDIWIEVTYLIGETVLCGFSLGILFTLYIQCLDTIIPQLRKPSRRRWALFHIAYTTTIVALVTTGASSDFRLAQLLWIDNRNYPGGPLGFLLNGRSAEKVWGWAAYVVASWLQDAYVIYRCLVFWEYNLLICGLPLLCFVGSLGTSIALLIETANPSQGLAGKLTIDFAICWYIFSVSVNVLATVAILSRLLWKRKTINAILGKEHSKVYTGVVAMLVESAALYSIFGLIFIGNYFKQNPVGNLVLPGLGNIEGISPLMIIYRVANGRGWTSPTIRGLNSTTGNISSAPLSALRFTKGPSTTLGSSSGGEKQHKVTFKPSSGSVGGSSTTDHHDSELGLGRSEPDEDATERLDVIVPS